MERNLFIPRGTYGLLELRGDAIREFCELMIAAYQIASELYIAITPQGIEFLIPTPDETTVGVCRFSDRDKILSTREPTGETKYAWTYVPEIDLVHGTPAPKAVYTRVKTAKWYKFINIQIKPHAHDRILYIYFSVTHTRFLLYTLYNNTLKTDFNPPNCFPTKDDPLDYSEDFAGMWDLVKKGYNYTFRFKQSVNKSLSEAVNSILTMSSWVYLYPSIYPNYPQLEPSLCLETPINNPNSTSFYFTPQDFELETYLATELMGQYEYRGDTMFHIFKRFRNFNLGLSPDRADHFCVVEFTDRYTEGWFFLAPRPLRKV